MQKKVFYIFVFLAIPVSLFFGSRAGLAVPDKKVGKVLGISEEISLLDFNPSVIEKPIHNLPVNKTKTLVKKSSPKTLDLKCDQAFVISSDDKFTFLNKNADEPHSIASLTKLATAIVFVRSNPDWESIYEMKRSDRVNGGRIFLYSGEKIKVRDVFKTSLIASANTATEALVAISGMAKDEFVIKMNELAKELDLKNTNFVDPTGVLSGNVSTAREVSILLKKAMSYNDIAETLKIKEHSFKTASAKNKTVRSTNALLTEKAGVRGKTGYIPSAGYCFASFVEGESFDTFIIVLGAGSKYDRFSETLKIKDWLENDFYFTYK